MRPTSGRYSLSPWNSRNLATPSTGADLREFASETVNQRLRLDIARCNGSVTKCERWHSKRSHDTHRRDTNYGQIEDGLRDQQLFNGDKGTGITQSTYDKKITGLGIKHFNRASIGQCHTWRTWKSDTTLNFHITHHVAVRESGALSMKQFRYLFAGQELGATYRVTPSRLKGKGKGFTISYLSKIDWRPASQD